MAGEFFAIINLWQFNRLPKAFDYKYSLIRKEDKKFFNSLKDAIDFASAN